MKKKLVLFFMTTMLVFALAGCGKKNVNDGTTEGSETGVTEETQDAVTNETTGNTASESGVTEENQEAVTEETAGSTAGQTEVADSAEVLNRVWDTFAQDQKFSAMGGDFNNPVDNAAGIFNIEDVENLTYMLYIPAENVALIDEAASLVHAMNANTFTGAAFHPADTADVQVLIDVLKENILNTQWLCGFPDQLMIFTINDEYVVSAFGNAEIMKNFKTGLMEVYGDAAVLVVEENIS